MGCSSSTPRDISLSTVANQNGTGNKNIEAPTSSKVIRLNQVRGFAATRSQEYDHMFRVILLGDSGVGKSSLTICYTTNSPCPAKLPNTVGVDIAVKDTEICGKKIRFQMFDPAGQERHWMRLSNFGLWRSANAVVVVYDITNRDSFEHFPNWLDGVKSIISPEAPIIMVGNKLDKADERVVSHQEAFELAQQFKLEYIETSAATADGVEDVFLNLGLKLLSSNELKHMSAVLSSSDLKQIASDSKT